MACLASPNARVTMLRVPFFVRHDEASRNKHTWRFIFWIHWVMPVTVFKHASERAAHSFSSSSSWILDYATTSITYCKSRINFCRLLYDRSDRTTTIMQIWFLFRQALELTQAKRGFRSPFVVSPSCDRRDRRLSSILTTGFLSYLHSSAWRVSCDIHDREYLSTVCVHERLSTDLTPVDARNYDSAQAIDRTEWWGARIVNSNESSIHLVYFSISIRRYYSILSQISHRSDSTFMLDAHKRHRNIESIALEWISPIWVCVECVHSMRNAIFTNVIWWVVQ